MSDSLSPSEAVAVLRGALPGNPEHDGPVEAAARVVLDALEPHPEDRPAFWVGTIIRESLPVGFRGHIVPDDNSIWELPERTRVVVSVATIGAVRERPEELVPDCDTCRQWFEDNAHRLARRTFAETGERLQWQDLAEVMSAYHGTGHSRVEPVVPLQPFPFRASGAAPDTEGAAQP